ncbi:DUF58 domain-containing protein [Marinobacter mobilis]|uniref:DUF58 domain-containing protein n=1 Tax=Marinobacter mobilis TaxID=488533 RepID=A0A1H2XZD7_9GAMM|nr:DUF58 domain-containing protein [Marinobacter mobilis]SDW97699.1 Protein of unknown function DUF58 [Marinobacter mobilis]
MPARQDDIRQVFASVDQLMRLEADGRLPDFHGRQRATSQLAGRHGSRIRGRGLDFDQLRHYQRGDDLRHLDWRATQRTGHPFVRSFAEERDRPTLVLCDQRMDMLFGSSLLLKATAAAHVAAVAAWVAFHAGDRVGGIVFTDQLLDTVTPHRSRQRVSDLLTRIARHNQALSTDNTTPRNEGQLDRVISRCLATAHHDQTVCIVSDFAGVSERTLGLLRQLAQHNDVLAFQIYDPLAVDLPRSGVVTVAEDEARVTLDFGHDRSRAELANFLQQRFHEVDDLLRRSQVPHLKISTAEPSVPQIRQALGLQREQQP